MIEYNVQIKNNKIVDSFKHSNPSMAEISNLVFLLHKKINELCGLDSKKKITFKYPIDKQGKFKEDKK